MARRKKFKRKILEGKLAVLYSPDPGTGWYSWEGNPGLLYDEDIVEAVLAGDTDEAARLGKTRYGAMVEGAVGLKVAWLDLGTVFEIEEYEGAESLRIIKYPEDFIIATVV